MKKNFNLQIIGLRFKSSGHHNCVCVRKISLLYNLDYRLYYLALNGIMLRF